MGIFDNFLGGQSTSQSTPTFTNEFEAYFAITYCAVNADGNVDDFEFDAMSKALILKKTFAGQNAVPYLKRIHQLTREYSGGVIIKAAATKLSSENKQAVFVTCVDLLLSNGHVAASEASFVNELVTVLGIDETWAQTATDVIMLKYC